MSLLDCGEALAGPARVVLNPGGIVAAKKCDDDAVG